MMIIGKKMKTDSSARTRPNGITNITDKNSLALNVVAIILDNQPIPTTATPADGHKDIKQ
jgi:hypothetical protein